MSLRLPPPMQISVGVYVRSLSCPWCATAGCWNRFAAAHQFATNYIGSTVCIPKDVATVYPRFHAYLGTCTCERPVRLCSLHSTAIETRTLKTGPSRESAYTSRRNERLLASRCKNSSPSAASTHYYCSTVCLYDRYPRRSAVTLTV